APPCTSRGPGWRPLPSPRNCASGWYRAACGRRAAARGPSFRRCGASSWRGGPGRPEPSPPAFPRPPRGPPCPPPRPALPVSRGRRRMMGLATTPHEGSGAARWHDRWPVPAPLRLHEATVEEAWVDYNGHLTESAYLLIFGDSSDAFFRFFGVDDGYRASGKSLYTAETHLHNLREVRLGERLHLTLQVLGVDTKRLHIVHEMYDHAGRLVATAEQMLLHVD